MATTISHEFKAKCQHVCWNWKKKWHRRRYSWKKLHKNLQKMMKNKRKCWNQTSSLQHNFLRLFQNHNSTLKQKAMVQKGESLNLFSCNYTVNHVIYIEDHFVFGNLKSSLNEITWDLCHLAVLWLLVVWPVTIDLLLLYKLKGSLFSTCDILHSKV